MQLTTSIYLIFMSGILVIAGLIAFSEPDSETERIVHDSVTEESDKWTPVN